MELGGKAPSIVCEDANLPNAALQCALGSFLHSGQICMSTERILVNKKIAGPFKDALRKNHGSSVLLIADKALQS